MLKLCENFLLDNVYFKWLEQWNFCTLNFVQVLPYEFYFNIHMSTDDILCYSKYDEGLPDQYLTASSYVFHW